MKAFVLCMMVLLNIVFAGMNVILFQQRNLITHAATAPLKTPEDMLPVLPSATPTTTPVPSPLLASPSATITQVPSPTPKKKSYSIAIFGDSMVDTMGENVDYLDKELKATYPNTTFKLYNYGVGAENVSMGLARFNSPLPYNQRNYPALPEVHPDIIIIASFAYNPFNPHDKNKHYTELKDLIKKAQEVTPHVYILSEIAPLKTGFGKGPGGVNWPDEQSNQQAEHIVEQLENAKYLAANLDLPLIDAFTASQSNGKFGNPVYVNSHDGIHPSVAGHAFMARYIVARLQL